MGFGRSGSAGSKLGVWHWVTRPLSTGLLPLPRTHVSFLPPVTPYSQLEESARKMVLPLTSSLFIDLCHGLATETC